MKQNEIKTINSIRLLKDARKICNHCGTRYIDTEVKLAYYSFKPFIIANIMGNIHTKVEYCSYCKEYVIYLQQYKQLEKSLNQYHIKVFEYKDKYTPVKRNVKREDKTNDKDIVQITLNVEDEIKVAISILKYLLNREQLYTYQTINSRSIIRFVKKDLNKDISFRQTKQVIYSLLIDSLNISPKSRKKFIITFKESTKGQLHNVIKQKIEVLEKTSKKKFEHEKRMKEVQKILNRRKTEIEFIPRTHEEYYKNRRESKEPTHCWNCQTDLSFEDEICDKCGHYICPKCGECMCSWWQYKYRL